MTPLRPYWRICKPGIMRMVVIVAAIGYAMANRGRPYDWLRFVLSMAGIGMGSAGAAVLNNFLERELDARMDRTRARELPAGVIEPAAALVFGIVLTALALVLLILASDSLLPAGLVLLTSALYVGVYTPLKRRTWLNTSVGAIPGAMPILCGWVSATGSLDFTGWILFTLMFAWQHPHFYAIAWLYRDDYRRAGFQMLSVVDERGHRLFIQVILYAAFLAAVSLVPWVMGKTGLVYAAAALALGLHGIYESLRFVRDANAVTARRLLRSTLIYLPALGAGLLLDLLFPIGLPGPGA